MKPHTRIVLDLSGVALREPEIPVQEGEEVIGVFPEALRLLYSFDVELAEAHTALHAELPPSGNPDDHPDPAVADEHRKLHAAHAYVRHLIIDMSRPLLADANPAFDSYLVRKDWKMVGVTTARMPHIMVLELGLRR